MLARGKYALGNEPTDGGRTERKSRSRLVERCLATVRALTIAVDRDLILMAERANPAPGPAVAVAGGFTGSVEQRGNRLVRHLTRQGANQIHDVIIGGPACLARAVSLHRQMRVVPALPMDDESSSIISVPTRPQNSNSVCQSRPLRASREASSDSTAPIRPSQIAARSFSKPGRRPPAPDQIIVDDVHIGPTQLPGALDEPILSPLAFNILHNLKGR